MLELIVLIVAIVVLVPAVLLAGGVALAALLGEERPERFLDDPAARRRALIGR
ncbi:MAG TPA: hypothetical protein VN238_08430 [Solirubrobacteraceae bacterium]|nr:hypothetical protein [Solirubrobacteraceae bacterium]